MPTVATAKFRAVIHHVTLEVSDPQRSGVFYDALLAPLGWRRHFDEERTIGWGISKPVFFVSSQRPARPGFGHVCFSAKGIAAVKAAWESAVGAGGISTGEPGAQARHGSGSYSAFLTDPDGHSIEVTVDSD